MNALLQQAWKAFEAENPHWNKGLHKNPDSLATPEYIISGDGDGREARDYRRAVPVPRVDRHGLPHLGKMPSNAAGKKFANRQIVAPAAIPDPTDCRFFGEPEDAPEEPGSPEASRAAIRAAILSQYRESASKKGKHQHKAVLAGLLDRKSTRDIAAETGLTERRVRQIIRGNAQRGEAGLTAWLIQINTEMQAKPAAPTAIAIAVRVELVHSKRKSLQRHAPVAQLAWDFEAMMGVAA